MSFTVAGDARVAIFRAAANPLTGGDQVTLVNDVAQSLPVGTANPRRAFYGNWDPEGWGDAGATFTAAALDATNTWGLDYTGGEVLMLPPGTYWADFTIHTTTGVEYVTPNARMNAWFDQVEWAGTTGAPDLTPDPGVIWREYVGPFNAYQSPLWMNGTGLNTTSVSRYGSNIVVNDTDEPQAYALVASVQGQAASRVVDYFYLFVVRIA